MQGLDQSSDLEQINCNYCSSDAQKNIYDFSPLKIVQCKKCGLVYTSPRLGLGAINQQLYGKEFWTPYELQIETNLPNIQKFNERWLVKLECHCSKSQLKVCEIGMGLGTFLHNAKMHGHQVCGVELSEYAVNYARTKFGIDTVYLGAAETIDQTGIRDMDAFVMLASIEHLQDPLGMLRKIHSCLSKDGLLLLSTGVWGCFNQIVAGKDWSIIAPQGHLYYFSQRTMQMLLERAGFSILTLETNSALINELTTNKLLVRLFNNKITSKLGIPYLTQKFKLGDEMFIVAQKRQR